MALRWIDNHCHLGWESDDVPSEEAIDRMVAEAQEAGVERFITVGTDQARSAAAVAAAGRHPGVVWATVGLHPHDAKVGLDGLVEMLAEPGVVAVGECGLDYYYEHSPRPTQRSAFATQIGWAHEHELVLMVHTREAWADTLAVLDAEGIPERTVFHCFTGGPAEAEACLERGGHLSFSGIVSFPSADDVRAAAALCPLDRALVETDSPYLAPVPHRGRPNRPALVPVVGEALAAAMGRPVEEVAAATWSNAARIYGLGP